MYTVLLVDACRCAVEDLSTLADAHRYYSSSPDRLVRLPATPWRHNALSATDPIGSSLLIPRPRRCCCPSSGVGGGWRARATAQSSYSTCIGNVT